MRVVAKALGARWTKFIKLLEFFQGRAGRTSTKVGVAISPDFCVYGRQFEQQNVI